MIEFQPLWFNMEHGTNGQKGLRKSFVDDKCGLHTKFIFQISKKVVMLLTSRERNHRSVNLKRERDVEPACGTFFFLDVRKLDSE